MAAKTTGQTMGIIIPVGNETKTAAIMAKIGMEDEITKRGKMMAETIKTSKKKGPPPDLKCLNCGKNHYVSK